MMPSESFLKAVWGACYRAAEAGGAEFPAACAEAAVNWLRNEAPRGRGREPGHRGWCYLPTDKAAMLERHRQMEDMADFGFEPAEIAEVLHYAEGTVKNYLSRRRRG